MPKPKPSFQKPTNETIKDVVDKLLNPVPVQPNLTPLGNNFYATPPTPQEPNYDDPFSDSPIGIDIEYVDDGCNIGIQLTGSLAFFKLPSFQFVWRNPDCTPRKDPFVLKTITMPSTTDKYFRLRYSPYYARCWEQYPNLEWDTWGIEDKRSANIQILSITGKVEKYFLGGVGWIYYWDLVEIIYRAKRTHRRCHYNYQGIQFYPVEYGIDFSWTSRDEMVVVDESYQGVYRISPGTEWNNNSTGVLADILSGDDDLELRYAGGFVLDYRFVQPEKYENRARYYYIGKSVYIDGRTYIDVSDGTVDLSNIPDNNYDAEYKCDVPLPLAPPLRPMKDCCYETKQIMYATQADLLTRIQELEIKNSQLEIKNAQLEQDKLAIENYINQLDQAGKEILNSITRLNIVFDIVGIFINNLFKLLFRR